MAQLPTTVFRQIPYRARMAFDSTTGEIARSAERLARRIDWSEWRPGRRTVLCLKRSSFIVDVRELRKRLDFNFVEISAAVVKHHQEQWISPAFRLQTYFYELLQEKLTWERRHLEQFGQRFLATAALQHSIDAVFAGNTDYWQDEAVKLGCGQLGIPFLVLGRENYSVELDASNVSKRFASSNFYFNGAAVAVYSKETQRVLDDSGCFAPNSVWTTGAPRFDAWHGVRSLPREDRNLVLLLSYADAGYLCPKNFREVLAIFIEIAKEREIEARFAIKVKKGDDADELRTEFPALRTAPIEIIFDQPLQQLYPQARVIVGTNSHAAIESMFLDCPLVVPWWSDAVLPRSQSILCAADPHDFAVAYYPKSRDEFRAVLLAGISNELAVPGNKEQRLDRFRHHIEIPTDGTTMSTAVGRFLEHYISPK